MIRKIITTPKKLSVELHNLTPENFTQYWTSLLSFVDKFGDDILKTFNTVWIEKGYITNLHKNPIYLLLYNNQIVGFRASAMDSEKYSGLTKTYYMIIDPAYRGNKFATYLFLQTLIDSCTYGMNHYYTTCSDNNVGWKFYHKLGIKEDKVIDNPFNGKDYVFNLNCEGIYTYEDMFTKIDNKSIYFYPELH